MRKHEIRSKVKEVRILLSRRDISGADKILHEIWTRLGELSEEFAETLEDTSD